MTGDPSYVELGVDDVAKATHFYSQLFGWEPQHMSDGASVHTGSLGIGIHGKDSENHFEVFFAVDDLEASLETVRDLGGGVIGDIVTSDGFGRWSECVDDQGVRFGLRELSR
ncbi:VOC family protein [Jatrophihabitans telluris]|uniref:VOC family protein n=1 Tax=Jatrophihabitans telluris TaxID=2038343 RepID=A0ABY4QT99_9ACTN|nr:VOC family protein [Jatrophihabitans telluris]UQX86898.1 VOC family protein [Jatrophihabitans telluris]